MSNLLHQRSSYVKYLDSNLARVDADLRRVQAYRAWGIEYTSVFRPGPAYAQHWRDNGSRTVGKVRLVQRGDVPLKECGRKEKKTLQKYAATARRRKEESILRVNKVKSARAAEAKKLARSEPSILFNRLRREGCPTALYAEWYQAEEERRYGDRKKVYLSPFWR